MRWEVVTHGNATLRSLALNLIGQAQNSGIIPLDTGEKVNFIDLHTTHPLSGKNTTFRVFPNGAVDGGTEDGGCSHTTAGDVPYFATMTVRFLHHDVASPKPTVRFESYEEEIVPGVGPDKELRTPEDIYFHLFRHLRDEHEFNPGEAAVMSWGLMPNKLPRGN